MGIYQPVGKDRPDKHTVTGEPTVAIVEFPGLLGLYKLLMSSFCCWRVSQISMADIDKPRANVDDHPGMQPVKTSCQGIEKENKNNQHAQKISGAWGPTTFQRMCFRMSKAKVLFYTSFIVWQSIVELQGNKLAQNRHPWAGGVMGK